MTTGIYGSRSRYTAPRLRSSSRRVPHQRVFDLVAVSPQKKKDFWTQHEPKQLDSPPLNRYLGDSAEELRHRLANANDYFQRKASEVLNDDLALRLLAALYQATIVDTSEVDTCQHGIALAKLTAANFCEIGADVIYITKSGQQFIDAINNA